MKIISPYTKALLLLVATLVVVIVFLWNKNRALGTDNVRLSHNYYILQKKSSVAQILTQREFRHFYAKYDSIANKLKIKTKNIKQVLVTKYNYKDSTLIKSRTIVDTIRGIINFVAKDSSRCYSVSGYVGSDSSVFINSIEIEDNLEVFLFDRKEKWFWFVKKFWKKPTQDVLVYSECKKDTILVKHNIQVSK